MFSLTGLSWVTIMLDVNWLFILTITAHLLRDFRWKLIRRMREPIKFFRIIFAFFRLFWLVQVNTSPIDSTILVLWSNYADSRNFYSVIVKRSMRLYCICKLSLRLFGLNWSPFTMVFLLDRFLYGKTRQSLCQGWVQSSSNWEYNGWSNWFSRIKTRKNDSQFVNRVEVINNDFGFNKANVYFFFLLFGWYKTAATDLSIFVTS